jgi:hypothetical protein
VINTVIGMTGGVDLKTALYFLLMRI